MTDATLTDGRGSVSAAISTRTVQLFHEYTGRGPTKAHTVINRDSVLVVMQDTLTQGERQLADSERQLADSGKGELVMQMRHSFQQVMSDQLIAMVEEHTGRTVRAFMSANHIDPDVAAEIFVLVPEQIPA